MPERAGGATELETEMEAYRIRKRLENGALHITGLDGLADEEVEVIILVEPGVGKEDAPHEEKRAERKPGSAKGQIEITDDFHLPLDEEALREFYG